MRGRRQASTQSKKAAAAEKRRVLAKERKRRQRERERMDPEIHAEAKRKENERYHRRVEAGSSIRYCLKDGIPYKTIEGQGFRDLCQDCINAGAEFGRMDINKLLPSRTTVSRGVDDEAEELPLVV